MDTHSRILITGAYGMLGTHVRAALERLGYTNLLCPPQSELDLLQRDAVERYFAAHTPAYVFHLAGLVYGLGGNMQNQTNAFFVNADINLNVLRAAAQTQVTKIFFAGTVASYPYPFKKLPLTEDQLFLGTPHAGEYGYATAKTLGYRALELLKRESNIDYCIGLFTNLFGEHDTFNSASAHVLPSLIYKVHNAIQNNTPLEVWGTGSATRDFLYAPDAAEAAVFLMNNFSGMCNVSSGEEKSISDVVQTLIEISAFTGPVQWQTNAPVGIEQRSVDNNILRSLGFSHFTPFGAALKKTYDWYKNNSSS